ncbi:hypothetical protein [Streptomyces parvus]|uniref:hypothetical protein n=1 Tax=Streptomyces parvus TaxID=66428 RepID=UPI003722BF18
MPYSGTKQVGRPAPMTVSAPTAAGTPGPTGGEQGRADDLGERSGQVGAARPDLVDQVRHEEGRDQ